MASDVLAVLDELEIAKAALVGWSDGACIAMILGKLAPERVTGVFFFGCNMDPSGTKELEFTPVLQCCFQRHTRDYAQLSASPDQFESFAAAVEQMMKTEPNYTASDLTQIRVPVVIVQSELDEFIKPEHAAYLAQSIPGGQLLILEGVSHFAPLQRPELFNEALLSFLKRL